MYQKGEQSSVSQEEMNMRQQEKQSSFPQENENMSQQENKSSLPQENETVSKLEGKRPLYLQADDDRSAPKRVKRHHRRCRSLSDLQMEDNFFMEEESDKEVLSRVIASKNNSPCQPPNSLDLGRRPPKLLQGAPVRLDGDDVKDVREINRLIAQIADNKARLKRYKVSVSTQRDDGSSNGEPGGSGLENAQNQSGNDKTSVSEFLPISNPGTDFLRPEIEVWHGGSSAPFDHDKEARLWREAKRLAYGGKCFVTPQGSGPDGTSLPSDPPPAPVKEHGGFRDTCVHLPTPYWSLQQNPPQRRYGLVMLSQSCTEIKQPSSPTKVRPDVSSLNLFKGDFGPEFLK